MFQFPEKYQQYIHRLSDVRVLGQIVFVVIVLLISWSGVKVIHANYQLQQQIVRLQQENEVQRLKNENQKLKNEYYNSPQYLELAARQNFGLAAPGEKELLVPKAVALAHVPAQAVIEQDAGRAGNASKKIFYARNIEAWIDFFFHRTPTMD
ncbi:MAG: hypothetical protein JWN75_1271 [Candidatus Saccharibacteria bacterium]|nr:hypothetical protein [Candidatus Saccharibacteria bacterium]MDB5181381.1 hypothetical protein [Candidatus Saccharibacteria bacterium]